MKTKIKSLPKQKFLNKPNSIQQLLSGKISEFEKTHPGLTIKKVMGNYIIKKKECLT